jgi:uncharacterized repeat protein (TIGR01451 family)
VVSGTDAPDPVATSSNLTYTLFITNVGTATANGVSITNILSSAVNFVSVNTTRGTCSNVSGVVHCDWTAVNAGTGGRVTIVARPTVPGIVTNVVAVGANEVDANLANNSLVLTTTAVNRRVLTSADFIQVQDVLASPAVPYPSTITVSGLTAAVHKVTVTLNNISHGGPDDLDILLVGPQGGYIMLMSDGQTSPALTDVTVTFDDAAAQPVPDTTGLVSGSYRPANYGNFAPDTLPPPAPQVPFFTGFSNLAIFNHTDPNGQWRLFVYDDEPEAGGWVDGWSLTLLTLEPMANLRVDMTDSPDPALPGDIITYTATVTNGGPVAATNVRATNQVPAGFEVVGYSVSRGSCTNTGNTIYCDIGPLAIGASEQLVVQARATRGGSYTNQLEVTSDQLDPQPVNNVALQRTVVDSRVDVGVDITSSRTPALLEQPLIYTLAVTNLGPDPANGVRVVAELPPGVLLVNSTPSQGSGCSNQNGLVTCALGTVASRGRATVFLTCRPTVLGPITNVVSVSSDQVDTNPTNNTAQNINTVDPSADLQLTMTDSPDPVALSQTLTYSIFVTNRGPSVASNIVVSDVLPASLRFVSAQTTHGACTNDSNALTCVVGQLPPGERMTLIISATAVSIGALVNSATVTSQPVDANSANNIANVSTLVIPAVELSITKAVDRGVTWEGDRLTYTLAVSNRGPSMATAARLNDLLPPTLRYNSAVAIPGSCTLQSGTVTCALGDIPPGGRATVTIVGTAESAGSLTNTANVFANEQDINLGNNVGVALTTVIPRTTSVSDANTIQLPEIGIAPLYPLTLEISGITAVVQRVRLTLPGFSHTYPDDLDVLLVGPGGQALAVMSDAGGASSVANIDLTLDDLASAVLPDGPSLNGGPFRPADYDQTNEFPAPAPPRPYASSFDVFTGTDPNGTWKLYIVDDAEKDSGILAGGWRLDIWARDPMADLSVIATLPPDVVAVGSNITVIVVVSNTGPASATGVTVTNAHGPELAFSGAVMSQGACTNDAGLVRCVLGDLPPGGSALLELSFTVVASGTISNSFGVAGSSVDLHPSNNLSAVSFVAENPPVILAQPRNRYVLAGATTTFEVIVSGHPPLSYQWYRNDVPLEGATGASLTINNVQAEVLGAYRVQISNHLATVMSEVALLGFSRPPLMETITDQFIGEDQLLTLSLPVSDPDIGEPLLFSAVCDDTNLVPTTNMTFTVNGTNYALMILPGTNHWGTNLITVTVTDSAGLSASRAFTLGVESINDYPRFTIPVGDQVMEEDGSITVRFQVDDVETSTNDLIIGARSYDDYVMPNSILGPWGPGYDPYIKLTPVKNRSGTALIEIRVRDGAGVRTTNLFTLTVLPVEDAPSIVTPDDVTISEDGELMVNFAVDDPETMSADLIVRVESSNTDLISNDSFVFGGDITSRTLAARLVPNQYGDCRVTLFVQDGAGLISSNGFWVTVDPVNDDPFVSNIPAIETTTDQTSADASFTIGDLESDPDSLVLTAISTNTALAPVAGIEFGGSGSNRTVRITPGTGEFGWTVVRVEVTDPDGGITVRDFEFTVNQASGPPVILQHPQSQVVMVGSPVTLRVVATGQRLTYQWQHDGRDLPDETNAVLTIASATGANRGNYQARVSNVKGSVTSLPAQLRVLETTRILSLTRTGGTVELTFLTIVGQRYFVEFQNSLGAGWTALPEVAGTGEMVTVTDPSPAASSRFYRVRIE